VNLPGSLRGALENLDAILPSVPHAVNMLRGDTLHKEQAAGRLIPLSEVQTVRA
jgi:hypothetical protein